MKTAKALGFVKGDFVWTGAFPGILVSDVHTSTPVAEVWGFDHESGSVYAHDLRKLTKAEFLAAAGRYGFDGSAYSEVAKAALAGV